MAIAVLESRFQEYCSCNPGNVSRLRALGVSVTVVQKRMRQLLGGITDIKCGACEHSCCECMPVEGWFTENDYFIYRMFYEAPFSLMIKGEAGGNKCAFLGSHGCSLPEDIRPFPCVKVNCLLIDRELEEKGRLYEFKELIAEINRLQHRIWKIIKT